MPWTRRRRRPTPTSPLLRATCVTSLSTPSSKGVSVRADDLWLLHLLSARVDPAAPELVEIDGEDDRCPDDDLLPERLHVLDHEAVLEHRRHECANAGHEDAADAAEEARAADDDGADRREVVRPVRD